MSRTDQPYAVLWQDSSTADATLSIVNDALVGREASNAGEEGGTSAQQPQALHADQAQHPTRADQVLRLPVHSVVLSVHSDYYKARLFPVGSTAEMHHNDAFGAGADSVSGGGGVGGRGSGGGRGGSGGGGGGGGGCGASSGQRLLVEHVASSEHAEALEAVVRFCYSHLLCEVGDAATQVSAATLLKVVELSDRHLVTLCMEAALAELAGRGQDMPKDAACAIFLDGLPPLASRSPQAAPIQNAALQHLQQRIASMTEAPVSAEEYGLLRSLRLDNAEAVCSAVHSPHAAGSCRLDLLLPHLPFQALLRLLQGPFVARSENSVLMMVDVWVTMHLTSTTAEQLQQLAHAVHLGRLSRAFLFGALGRVPWLHLTVDQELEVACFASSSPAQQAAMLQQYTSARWGDRPAWRTWFKDARTTWPESCRALDVVWTVSQSTLQVLLQQACSSIPQPVGGAGAPAVQRLVGDPFFPPATHSPAFFCNGIAVWLGLTFSPEQRSWSFVSRASIVGGRYFPMIDCQVQVTVGSRVTLSLQQCSPADSGCVFGHPHLLRSGLDMQAWAPHLTAGKLVVRASITAC